MFEGKGADLIRGCSAPPSISSAGGLKAGLGLRLVESCTCAAASGSLSPGASAAAVLQDSCKLENCCFDSLCKDG